MKLILASKSKYRKIQLKALGLKFKTMNPGVDEGYFKRQIKDPRRLAATLAIKKAEAIYNRHPQATVIGSDQLVELNNRILGKPKNKENAIKQLKAMRNKTHRLITAVAVIHRGAIRSKVVVATIKMRNYSNQEILDYIHLDKPFDCAGSYKFERAGLKLVQKMQISDPSALIGLPIIALTHLLRQSR
jgi:septum formation protein